MNKTSFSRHFAALCALFLLGGGLLYPFRAGPFLTALTASVLLSFLAFFLSDKFFYIGTACHNPFKKILFCLLWTGVAVWALFCFADSFNRFTRFATDLLLKTDKMTVAVLIFAFVTAFLILKGKRVIYKYALLSFFLSAAILIFCSIAFSGNFDFRNLLCFQKADTTDFFGDLYFCLYSVTLPSLLLPFATPDRGRSPKQTSSGLLVGAVLLFGCTVSVLLLFGENFAKILEYPFAAAVSTISLGRLFTRPDYISYYIYFICAIVRCAVPLLAVRECFKRLNNILK